MGDCSTHWALTALAAILVLFKRGAHRNQDSSACNSHPQENRDQRGLVRPWSGPLAYRSVAYRSVWGSVQSHWPVSTSAGMGRVLPPSVPSVVEVVDMAEQTSSPTYVGRRWVVTLPHEDSEQQEGSSQGRTL